MKKPRKHMLSIHISKYILFLTVGVIAYDNDVYISIGVHILAKGF